MKKPKPGNHEKTEHDEFLKTPELGSKGDTRANEILKKLGLKSATYNVLSQIIRIDNVVIDQLLVIKTSDEVIQKPPLSSVSMVDEKDSLIRIKVTSKGVTEEVTLKAHLKSKEGIKLPVDSDYVASVIRGSSLGDFFATTVTKKVWESEPLLTSRSALCSWLVS